MVDHTPERPAKRATMGYIIGAAWTTAIAQVQTTAEQIFNANAGLRMFSAAPVLQSVVFDAKNNLADAVTASSVPLFETSNAETALKTKDVAKIIVVFEMVDQIKRARRPADLLGLNQKKRRKNSRRSATH